VDGDLWVEGLLTALPGGELGFLIVVNLLVFVLAFFLDFFEIAFIIVPLVGAGGPEAGYRSGLVRRASWHQHADLVHASTFWFRPVLPAQRGAESGAHQRYLLGRDSLRGLIQIIMVVMVLSFPGLVGVLPERAETGAVEIRAEDAGASYLLPPENTR
jgi:TRAP-type mannitol/chloroaromatic compound transport system permease large subunit